jgi:2'-hydroxyisoflavone reductase
MRLLILGGSGFLGRHVTERALARGWDVTHFNRGRRNPGLYPEVTEIFGDRKDSLRPLEGLAFDSVIDTSGYFPRDVEASAAFLKDLAPHYVFISTVSTYTDHSRPINEDCEVFAWDAALETADEVEPTTYGTLKAECERRARAAYGDACLVLRPGLIVGKYDPTGRFSYWPHRFRKGGRIVVPEHLEANLQIIEGADLADWTLDLAEQRKGGTFNAVGPSTRLTFHGLIETLMPLAPEGTEVVPISNEVLQANGVAPWTGLPLWLPREAQADGMMQVDLSRMLAAGLKHRALEDTVADILSEIDETGAFVAGASLTAEAEADLLAAQ